MPFRRWLPQVLLALAVAAVVIPFPLSARAQDGCVPLETLAPAIEQSATFIVLHGEPLQRALAIFNASPAFDGTTYTSAYIGIREDGYGFLIVGMDGTACAGLLVEKDSVRAFLEIIFGASA